MNHDDFFQSLKAAPPSGIYLLEGEEEYVKRSALSQLEKAVDLGAFAEMNRTTLRDPDADTLIAAAETLPFMAEHRLVIVRDSGMLGGKAKDYDEAQSAERLRTYLPELPATTVLVFYQRGPADKRKKLYQALKKTANVVEFGRLSGLRLQDYVAKTLKKAGYAIQRDACELLIYSVGDDLSAVLSETDKLMAYCADSRTIAREDIQAVCTARTEYRVFELAQTVLEGKGEQAFGMLNGLLTDGEQPLMLLSLLSRQCRQVYDAKLMEGERRSQADIAAKLGIPPFAVRQQLVLARRYSVSGLSEMIRYCTELEFRVKSGLMPEEGAMEQAMLHILLIGSGQA